MHWLWMGVLIAGVAVLVPALDHATDPPRTDRASEPVANAVSAPVTFSVEADGRGHFLLGVVVAGRQIAMMADTGASAVVLTQEDARRAGINPSSLAYDVPVRTANGTAHAARVVLPRVEVGPIVREDVEALVATPDALGRSLLGMSFLGRLGEFSMRDGTLTLAD